jgi:nicotinamide mononucleotide transporter
MGVVFSWIGENWIELAAALVSITYVILAIKQIIWLWIFGILSALLYAWVYAHSGFYAGMGLQAYYAFISIYGWIHWSSRSAKAKADPSMEAMLPVVRLSLRLFLILILVWLLLWQGIGLILSSYTDSKIPYWDAFTAAGGVVATWMIARKLLEQWFFWIVIDVISTGLYLWQGLYVTTLLYLVYIIMAILGYRQWRRAWKATL